MRRPGVIALLLAALVISLALPGAASAVRLVQVATGFDQLTRVQAPRSGDPGGTLYVVEQEGQIWKWRNGTRRLFLDIRGIVSCCGERGLLGLAFDRQYGTNDLLYVNYTNNAGDTRVVRYRANAAHTSVLKSTRRLLLSVDQPAPNHNGGHLALGPNGRLYTGLGDGGGACDPRGRAQNMGSRLGKLLSLDPRAVGAGWRIDGYGLRNPWQFSFDRSNGRLYIGDVGQDDWEEVSTRAPGTLGGTPENYLWDVYEGRQRSGCTNGGLRGNGTRVFPISTYSHSLGCSITGGYAYRGRNIPGLRGWYVFADFCSGRIWRVLYNGGLRRGRSLMIDSPHNITSFGEGIGGELYVTHQGGTIYRLARS